MDKDLLEYLEKVNAQEQEILRHEKPVLSYFVKGKNSTVFDSDIVMSPMTMIDILKQPRFVPLPDHTHNYLELIYMCSGSTTHVINASSELTLKADELLFLPQGTSHSVSAAGYHDIAVSFAILPAFLQYPLSMLREDTLLRRFISQVSRNDSTECEFLHFHLQDMPEAKNLLENMTRILLKRRRNSRQILQATMGVLLLDLSGRSYTVTVGSPSNYEETIVLDALNYIETEYKTASLADFCKKEGKPDYYISRLMKRYFPYTFTQYLQKRRLLQAAYLLTETKDPIEAIILDVGYENSSHFHRLFKSTYGMTPGEYRRRFSMTEWPMFNS
nr:AraC family transcriptional regulator [uncultured Merdimonas sp.]